MSEEENYPKYQYPGLPDGEKTLFHGPEGVIEIDGYQQEIFSILKLADGTNTVKQIKESEEHGLEGEIVEALLHDLGHLGIIGESRQAYKHFHGFTNNPTRFDSGVNIQDIIEITQRPYRSEKQGNSIRLNSPTSGISEIMQRRESTRNFSDKALDIQIISEITATAYSLDVTPSPSAGGLYPIKLYVMVGDGHEIPAGYYQYAPVESSLIHFNDSFPRRRLEHVMNSDSLLHGAPVIYVIAADLSRHNEKYADRGYRYTLLEAGHVAQNIHLATSELGLGSLEYGGFNDSLLANELGLEDNIAPLITVGVGYKDLHNKRFDSVSTLASLEMSLVGEDKPIDTVSVDIFSEAAQELGFYHANAHYRSPNNSYSDDPHKDEKFASGTASSMHLAQLKAIAEAYERYASGKIRYDVKCAASELNEQWLDPSLIRPLSKSQIESSHHLVAFNKEMSIEWIKGTYLNSGEGVLVPIDLVLYPLTEGEMGRKLVAHADSSGVAAHTERGTAIEKALLELIERDAIAKNWLKKESLCRLSYDCLQEEHRKRVDYWAEKGFKIDVIDMTPDGSAAAIINVTIRNLAHAYPYFVNGASASLNYDEAINKALEEAELGLVHALHTDVERNIDMQDVYSPADHGIFYLHPENSHHISWLWEGSEITARKKLSNINIIDSYNPIVLDLDLQGEPLHVVRVIEPSLVPISFGFASEYFLHPAVDVKSSEYKPEAPHYFA